MQLNITPDVTVTYDFNRDVMRRFWSTSGVNQELEIVNMLTIYNSWGQ